MSQNGQQGLLLSTSIEKFLNGPSMKGRGQNTIKNYKADLINYKKYLDEHPSSWTIFYHQNTIDIYISYLKRKKFGSNTVRRRLMTLRNFFDFLIDQGVCKERPLLPTHMTPKFLDIPRPTEHQLVLELWHQLCLPPTQNVDEETNLFKLLIYKRNLIIFYFIYQLGLKISTLSKVSWPDLSNYRKPRINLKYPKKETTAPLDSFIWGLIQDYKKLLKAYEGIRGPLKGDRLLFRCNLYAIVEKSLSPRGLELIFSDWSRRYNIEIKPRELRQAGIINLIQLGHKDDNLRTWLGLAKSYSFTPYRDIHQVYLFGPGTLEEIHERTLLDLKRREQKTRSSRWKAPTL